MSATVLTVTAISRTGVALAGTAATVTDGDCFPNTGKEYVFIKNAGGSPITATLKFGTGGVVDGQSATERTVSITNGTEKIIGPFPPSYYNDANGRCTVICSAVTNVTIQVVSVS